MENKTMKLLAELAYENSVNRMYRKMLKIEEVFDAINAHKETLLTEGSIDNHNGPLEAKFDEISRRMDGARRGLGLANTLRTPEERRQHKSRIMGNLNRIRNMLKELMQELGMSRNPNMDSPRMNQRPQMA